jgi:O-antigen/teichoic acid export membrane protein
MSNWPAIAENAATRAAALLSNMIVLFATARVLGPHDRGVLVSITTWIALLAVAGGLSLGQVSHRRIQAVGRKDWLPDIAGTLAGLAGLASVVVWGVVLVLMKSGDGSILGLKGELFLLAATMMPLLILDEYARNLLAACGRMREYSLAQAAGSVARVSSVAAVLAWQPTVTKVLICLVAAQAIVVIVQWRTLWKISERTLRFSWQTTGSLAMGSLLLHPNTVASFLLMQANVLLLDQLGSSADVANYQLALQISFALLLVPQAAAMMLFGRVAESGPNEAWPDTRRLLWQVLLLGALASVALAAVGPGLLGMLVGQEFQPASQLLIPLLMAMCSAAMAEVLAPQWIARGLFGLTTVLTAGNALVAIAASAFLIEKHGALGAAWGLAASYAIGVAGAQLMFAFWCEKKHRVARSSAARRERPIT